jgi:SAM-dependent methyltransferase
MRGIEQIPVLYDALMWIMERVSLGDWRRSLVEPGAWASGHPGAAGSGAPDPWGPTLEVGCGTGRNFSLYPAGTVVVGMDPDPAMLRAARRRSPEAHLVRARAEALPFRDNAFPVVVSSLVFCSVADPEAGLREVARVLHPGGTLRMLEHVRPRSRLAAWGARKIQPLWTAVAGGCHPDRDTEATVEQAGFRILPGGRRSRGVLRRFDAKLDGSPGS